jgi:hypothetical protein
MIRLCRILGHGANQRSYPVQAARVHAFADPDASVLPRLPAVPGPHRARVGARAERSRAGRAFGDCLGHCTGLLAVSGHLRLSPQEKRLLRDAHLYAAHWSKYGFPACSDTARRATPYGSVPAHGPYRTARTPLVDHREGASRLLQRASMPAQTGFAPRPCSVAP